MLPARPAGSLPRSLFAWLYKVHRAAAVQMSRRTWTEGADADTIFLLSGAELGIASRGSIVALNRHRRSLSDEGGRSVIIQYRVALPLTALSSTSLDSSSWCRS